MAATTVDVKLPGRLGDPTLELGSDPRSDPRMVAAFSPYGLAVCAPALPVDRSSLLEELLAVATATEQGFDGLFGVLSAGVPAAEGVQSRTEVIKGVDGNDITLYADRPVEATGPLPGLLHLHGGGMAILKANSSAMYRSRLAGRGAVVIGVEFRNAAGELGPHPFPAGLNDCTSALDWMHDRRAELGLSSIVITGESGGGNLSLATTLKAKRDGHLDRIDGVYAQVPLASSGERRERILYGSGGDDGERGRMARPYVVEVSAVHGGNRGNAEAFGDCYQRGVGASQPPIGVLPDEFGHPPQVDIGEVQWAESMCGLVADRVDELCLGVRITEPIDEAARLGQNGDRKGQLAGLFFQPAAAESLCAVSDRSANATMTLVSTRITTNGQRPKPSASSSSTRWDRSWRPLSKLPTNAGRGRRSAPASVERECRIGSTTSSARSICSSSISSTSRCSCSRVVMDPLCQPHATLRGRRCGRAAPPLTTSPRSDELKHFSPRIEA